MKRSDHVVRNFLKNPDDYGKNNIKAGRKKKITKRDERQIIREVSNSTKSCEQVKRTLGLNVHRQTVWRTIKANPNIERQKMKKAPRLEPPHKHRRLQFARDNMNQEWILVGRFYVTSSSYAHFLGHFFGRKKFNLDGPDGFNSYWRDLRKEPRYFSRRNFGGGSVMVWAAFSSVGKLELRFVTKRMNGHEYQGVLSHSLLPFLRRYRRFRFKYQQDNAGVHCSKRPRPGFIPMMQWFRDHGIELLEWPSRSPDLNPIENLWGIMVRRVYADNRQFQTVDELKQAILEAWDSIETEVLQNLINSMPNRIFQVIQRSGGVTDY